MQKVVNTKIKTSFQLSLKTKKIDSKYLKDEKK